MSEICVSIEAIHCGICTRPEHVTTKVNTSEGWSCKHLYQTSSEWEGICENGG